MSMQVSRIDAAQPKMTLWPVMAGGVHSKSGLGVARSWDVHPPR